MMKFWAVSLETHWEHFTLGVCVCVTRTRLVSKVFDVNPSHSKDRPLKWEINSIKVDLPNKECLKAKK